MSESKKFEQKNIAVGDTEYVLQKLPTRKALEIKQKWLDANGQIIELNLYDEVLEHIVVNPKCRVDDFDDISELQELGAEALNFQFGGKYTKNN